MSQTVTQHNTVSHISHILHKYCVIEGCRRFQNNDVILHVNGM